MAEFMKTLLSLSFSGTVLLLLLVLLRRLCKGKISRRWQYYIWLAAALRFLLPFTPGQSVAGLLFGAVDTAVVSGAASGYTADPNAEGMAAMQLPEPAGEDVPQGYGDEERDSWISRMRGKYRRISF